MELGGREGSTGIPHGMGTSVGGGREFGGSRGKGGIREREGRRTVQVQRTRGRLQGQFPIRRMGGGGGKLDGWEEGEEDCGEFGNGSEWLEREEVRGGSDGEKTGEIVEFLQGRCSRSSANGG